MRKLTVLAIIAALLISVTGVFAQTASVTPPPTDTPTATNTLAPTDTLTATSTATDTATATATGVASTATATAPATTTGTPETTAESTASVTPSLTATPTSTGVIVTAAPTTFTIKTLKLDTTPRIAIISAFDPELTALLGQTTVEASYFINGVRFTTGRLAGHEVVEFLSGVSMVNAAMTTQLGLDYFTVTRIIFSGIAGGVNPAYHIGDVVVPAQWAQYQEGYAGRQLSDGSFATPSSNPGLAPFEFLFPQTVNVRSANNQNGEDKLWFAVDPQMLAVAQSIAGTIQLTNCTSSNVCLTDTPQIHVGGNGVSGPTFVDNANYRQYVFNTFQADALDEETAASIQVAYANGIPFLAFRSLSDLAGGGPGANEIGTFFQLAANNSAAVTVAFLKAWPQQ